MDQRLPLRHSSYDSRSTYAALHYAERLVLGGETAERTLFLASCAENDIRIECPEVSQRSRKKHIFPTVR
jgi:hypothetical protein